MAGGTKLNMMWCDPASTVTAWNSPSALGSPLGGRRSLHSSR
jgi:hypothetical protein